MTLRPATIYADAWAGWRRDWPVLTAIAGMFVFLPQLALLLLVPDLPDMSTVTGTDPNDPTMQAYMTALQAWVGHYGLIYLCVVLAAMYGQFAIVAVYLAPGRPTVGSALGTALRLLPRLVLASIVWMLPLGLAGMILIRLPFLIFPIFALILARTLLVGPAILAARPIGAVAAIGRSFVLTRGHMLLLASVVLSVVLAQYLAALPFVAVDQWMAKHAPNPIARAIVDTFAAGTAALGATAMALVQVAAWRRLSPR
ncbi:MAG: hypothetical protein E7773_13850 [Sphingomonas sp.]|uniref:hypothetical protein n=1 Tax=Sphingomonas sp. TaxID=28214 RepID=UPI00122120F6|nr:hypothetical protein [Sphingomonas sp.]THD34744.1 MAG: hypothetical protein E7773_13850 [Sphingomonas sp.]